MALNFCIFAALPLFAVCASAFEGGTGEGWTPGTKPVDPTIIGVRGAIFCHGGGKLAPVEGAFAKVKCAAEGKKPFTMISAPTDKKGFFMATFSLHEIELSWDLNKDCKAYLHSSPWKICRTATNVNMGVSGAPLRTYKSIPNKHLKVYYVGPFTFTHARA